KNSKARQGRANQRQIETLVGYLENHPHVASGKFNMMNAKENLDGSWEDLCSYLNSLATDGKQKDVKSWKTTWRDYKSKVSDKIQKLRSGRAKTGNNPINITLSDLDKRILGIIGHDYVEGLANVPDSFPEEQINAIEELAAGNRDIEDIGPAPIIIPELNYNDVEENNINNIQLESETCINNESLTTQENVIIEFVEPSTSKDTETVITVQFSDARISFQNIADKHADAMIVTNAMKSQADTVVKISDVIDKMIKNEERQTQLLQMIFQALNNEK
ncbi:hypothetical protein ALC57_06544, partial [Trachymyrmex cornetzi]